MDAAPQPPRRFERPLRLLWKATVITLALIGLFCLIGLAVLRLLSAQAFERTTVRQLYSPDRTAIAEVEVTRGPTVFTTRVYVRRPDQEPWLVYRTKDSDFQPPLKWLDRQTLLVSLPCDRFDYASNPDDWARPEEQRLKVRFGYVESCR